MNSNLNAEVFNEKGKHIIIEMRKTIYFNNLITNINITISNIRIKIMKTKNNL